MKRNKEYAIPEMLICSHHVGGRAGNRAFPVMPRFEKDFINVIYDADSDCVEQIAKENKQLPSRLIVLPYCLDGSNRKKAVFNINYDPYSSSLLKLNPDYADWYFYFRRDNYDYIAGETLKTVERRSISTVTLDQLMRLKKAPPPDILSLDAQGVEYDILKGAEKTLGSHVLAILCESEFRQLYIGQKLFGKISEYLLKKDYEFVKFTRKPAEYSPYLMPIGFRGEGFQTVGDVLFLRKVESLMGWPRDKRQIACMKLAFISLVFNQYEYAFKCIHMAKAGKIPDGLIDSYPEYMKMLRELVIASGKMEKRIPQRFPDKYTFTESKARFSAETKSAEPSRKDLIGQIRSLKELEKYPDSPVEVVIRKYGMDQGANLVKRLRIEQNQLKIVRLQKKLAVACSKWHRLKKSIFIYGAGKHTVDLFKYILAPEDIKFKALIPSCPEEPTRILRGKYRVSNLGKDIPDIILISTYESEDEIMLSLAFDKRLSDTKIMRLSDL